MRNRMRNGGERPVPPATCALIGINFVVYLVLEFLGSTQSGTFMLEHGALYAPAVLEGGEYYRLLSAAFLHFGAAHLMNNLLMLFIMGPMLERERGSVRFLLIYLVSAVGANVFTVFFYTLRGIGVISAGASGALMGIIGALFAYMLRSGRSVEGVDHRRMLLLIVLMLYSGFVSSSTNNAAHLSGLAFGFLLGLVL